MEQNRKIDKIIECLKQSRLLSDRKVLFFIIFITGVICTRYFMIEAYRTDSDYMEKGLQPGDYYLVNKFANGYKLPFMQFRIFKLRGLKRSDVVVLEYPEDPSKKLVYRIVGLPGETVQIINKRVYVNDRLYADPHEIHIEPGIIPEAQNPRDNTKPVKVPEYSYFVLGDNRDIAYDSRFWGCVKHDRIEGIAFFKYWSWDKEQRKVRWGNVGKMIN